MPQVRTLLAAALLALAATAPAGCASENALEGSLGEVLDLGFEDVEVSITETAVIVGYHKPHGEGRDIVFKLVSHTVPAEVVPKQVIDLSPAADGSSRAECTRSAADDPIRTFAAIRTGTLTFDAPLVLDQPVGGEFRVTLGEGGDAGKGRTAFGTFRVLRVVPGS
ncbi:MAG: hypothetical protein HY901_08965 [Deltaproteobacteria bacterium]|nr:hypothetical protein [Deltaproteobacteria bacterium]